MAYTNTTKWNASILNPLPPSMSDLHKDKCVGKNLDGGRCNMQIALSNQIYLNNLLHDLQNKELHTIVRGDLYGFGEPDVSLMLCSRHQKQCEIIADRWMASIRAEVKRIENEKE